MNPVIIIPAYNPPNTFNNLISSILTYSKLPIIIVDDGSDKEIQIDKNSVIILRNRQNMGKGIALMKGMSYALKHGYTHSVTLDADSQHDPSYIPQFLDMDEGICIVLGKREFKGNMPIHRRFSNLVTSKLISKLTSQQVLDSQCGYRRYKLAEVTNESYNEDGFQFESEVLIRLLRRNYRLQHISIPTIYTDSGSSMNNFRDTIKFMRLIFRNILWPK